MASAEELANNHTKEELVEKAKEAELSGYSTKNKDELAEALANLDNEGGAQTLQDDGTPQAEAKSAGYLSEGSDEDNPEVVSNLSPEGQEALADMGDEAAEKADLALDASGPLHLENPADRVMTGAVSEDHAKEQEKALEGKPEDWTGDTTEAGFDDDGNAKVGHNAAARPATAGQEKDNLSENDDRELREVRPEDVIDFPPPVGAGAKDKEKVATATVKASPAGIFSAHISPVGPLDDPTQDARRGYQQKSVFYTDGLSGTADHNHERAYEYGELLQSNDPTVRKAGDESLSEAAKAAKTDDERTHAKNVILRDDDPSQVTRSE